MLGQLQWFTIAVRSPMGAMAFYDLSEMGHHDGFFWISTLHFCVDRGKLTVFVKWPHWGVSENVVYP